MFIVSLIYKVKLSEVDKHIDAHVSYLEKNYATGNFIASGRKVPRTGGVILADVANREQLDSILKQDPFYIENLATYDVTEFIVSMTSSEFEALKSCN